MIEIVLQKRPFLIRLRNHYRIYRGLKFGRWMAIRAAWRISMCCALLALAGCTTADVTLPDGTHVAFSRFATDAAVSVTPDGLTYSSSPSAAAQQQMTDTLVRAVGLLVASSGAPTRPPLPARLQSPEPAMIVGGGL